MEDTISPLGGEMSIEEMSTKLRTSPRLEHRPLQRSASASATATAWPGPQRKVFEPRDSRSDPLDPEIFLDGKDSPKQLMPVTNSVDLCFESCARSLSCLAADLLSQYYDLHYFPPKSHQMPNRSKLVGIGFTGTIWY